MTVEEIIAVAKTFEEAIEAQDMSKSEAIMLLALIQARLYKKICGVPTSVTMTTSTTATPMVGLKVPEVTPPPVTPAPRPEAPFMKRSIQYGPEDLPPPFKPEPLPAPPTVDPNQVIAPANKACVCSSCQTLAYVTNKVLKNGMKLDEFKQAFTPSPGVPELDDNTQISNVGGTIRTDCPSCGGNMSLYLVGKKEDTGGATSF